MQSTTQAWVSKAEANYTTALVLVRRTRRPVPAEAVCLHAEQCVGLYLKSRLVEAGVAFPKTTVQAALLRRVAKVEPTWAGLAVFACRPVALGYPGSAATRTDVARSVRICRAWRRRVRVSLGL